MELCQNVNGFSWTVVLFHTCTVLICECKDRTILHSIQIFRAENHTPLAIINHLIINYLNIYFV